jgi:hypothetical protein
MGNDGTFYVSMHFAPGYQGDQSLSVLNPRDLTHQGVFITQGRSLPGSEMFFSLLSSGTREMVAAACNQSSLCLLDPQSPGGTDRKTPLYSTGPMIPTTEGRTRLEDVGISGNPAIWQDTDGTRWIVVPVMGQLNSALNVPTTNGAISNGFLMAFKVQVQNGTPALIPVWASRDLAWPQSPVVANGVVFALSAGEFTRRMTAGPESFEEKPKAGTRATLYALDARTGKELYSSRNLITGPASFTGLTVTTGRVYFGGLDGTLYAFGMYMEH